MAMGRCHTCSACIQLPAGSHVRDVFKFSWKLRAFEFFDKSMKGAAFNDTDQGLEHRKKWVMKMHG